MRIRIALVSALAWLATVPAEAARDVFVRDSPESAVATCLRATTAPGLVGMLGPLERRTSPYDLLRVSAHGVSVAATARLGILDECPGRGRRPERPCDRGQQRAQGRPRQPDPSRAGGARRRLRGAGGPCP